MINNNHKIINKTMISGWLQKAEDDFLFAKVAFNDTEFYDHVGFLAQQSVEKYLKVIIIINKGSLAVKERTHNLIYLSNICKQFNLDFSDFEHELRDLSEAYIPARYPVGNLGKFTKKEAQKYLNAAKSVIGFIKDNIDFNIYK